MNQQNQEAKTLDLILKMSVNMENGKTEIDQASVEAQDGTLSYREKVLAYFKNEVNARKEEWKGFDTGIADTELSQAFILQRTIAETKYWQAVNYLQCLELL